MYTNYSVFSLVLSMHVQQYNFQGIQEITKNKDFKLSTFSLRLKKIFHYV